MPLARICQATRVSSTPPADPGSLDLAEIMNRVGLWPVRALWLLLPFTAGIALGDAMAGGSFLGVSTADHVLASARTMGGLAWIGWTAGLLALAIPRVESLTAIRMIAPIAVLLSLWAALSTESVLGLLGAALATIACGYCYAPSIGEVFVNGSAYGDEHRALLRAPIELAAIAAPLMLALMTVAVFAGPLLLARGSWVLGVLALIAGGAIVAIGARALHGLSRRWLVFVPAGVVVHDLMALTDPVLFRQSTVKAFGPIEADRAASATDLTRNAFGLPLGLDLTTPTEIVLRTDPRRATGETTMTESLLVAPTRPASTLTVARDRKIG